MDLSVLLDRETLDSHILATAINATFVRRGMQVPSGVPIGLSDEFATDPTRKAMWQSFLKKNELDIVPLANVVTTLRAVLQPILVEAAKLMQSA